MIVGIGTCMCVYWRWRTKAKYFTKKLSFIDVFMTIKDYTSARQHVCGTIYGLHSVRNSLSRPAASPEVQGAGRGKGIILSSISVSSRYVSL